MNDTCTWTQDSNFYYYISECGDVHQFTDGGPKENKFRFCPYCGKKLVDVPYIEEEA